MSKETPDGAACKKFFDGHKRTLAALARETVEEGYAAEEFVLVCIDASNPDWKLVVRNLVEVFDVEHKDGDPDVVLGAMSTNDVVEVFTQLIPGIVRQLTTTAFPAGAIRIIVVHGESVGLFVEELGYEDEENVPDGTGGMVN